MKVPNNPLFSINSLLYFARLISGRLFFMCSISSFFCFFVFVVPLKIPTIFSFRVKFSFSEHFLLIFLAIFSLYFDVLILSVFSIILCASFMSNPFISYSKSIKLLLSVPFSYCIFFNSFLLDLSVLINVLIDSKSLSMDSILLLILSSIFFSLYAIDSGLESILLSISFFSCCSKQFFLISSNLS